MSRTVEIPGGSAVLRDPGELTERQRRRVRSALFAVAADALGDVAPDGTAPQTVHLTAGMGERMFEIRDAAIIASLVSWTLEAPLPTVESVQDLPADLYDTLAVETAGLVSGLGVDFNPTPDPESPTGPPSSSSGRLAAEVSPSPVLSPNGGVSTPTASFTG